MTDIDYKGKRVHAPKEIWMDSQLYDIAWQIENELCRQLNNGLLRDVEQVKIIKEFIERSKK